MEPFHAHQGVIAPLDRGNVDTDAIIPKQYLKSVKRTGFGVKLFDDQCRYFNPGNPGEHCASAPSVNFKGNFEGRQGQGRRTHLVSPVMAAAAIAGHFVDARAQSPESLGTPEPPEQI